uniref:Uncharacterized protein n=1 Tax=Sinocyclocheilus grahami TaxID=75366 RepID=A0A672T4K0_SINGR
MCCFLTDDVWSRFGERAAVRMCCFRAKVAVRPAQDGFLWAHLQSLSTTNSLPLSFSPLAVSFSLCLSLDSNWVARRCLLRPLVRFLYACESFIPSPLHLSLSLSQA